jgi:hypothetical protein
VSAAKSLFIRHETDV